MARILFADDDRDLTFMVQFSLEDAGHEVLLAENGDDALALLDANDFDLCLFDVMMPGHDGFALTRSVGARETPMPVILLTARDRDSDRQEGLDAGAADYIVKPFSPADLLERIEKVLAEADASG